MLHNFSMHHCFEICNSGLERSLNVLFCATSRSYFQLWCPEKLANSREIIKELEEMSPIAGFLFSSSLAEQFSLASMSSSSVASCHHFLYYAVSSSTLHCEITLFVDIFIKTVINNNCFVGSLYSCFPILSIFLTIRLVSIVCLKLFPSAYAVGDRIIWKILAAPRLK